MKKLFLLLILVFALAACSGEGEPEVWDWDSFGMPVQGGPMLHAFSWSFNTVAEYMPIIAEAGFTAVQVSPITESVTRSWSAPGDVSGMNLFGDGAWWFLYQPVSFRIGNYMLGTEEEFANMTRVAKEHGVKIIVDAVINHMTAYSRLICREFYNLEGGAIRPRMEMGPTRLQQTQGQLLGLWDINTHNPVVQQHILQFLQRAVELGAAGFRYDAIFMIELPTEDDPELASDFWPVVLANGSEFQYGEILGVWEADIYVDWMPVTDAEYGRVLGAALRAGELSAANLTHYRVHGTPCNLVTWVESHDTFGNYGETADLTARQIMYGWAVIGSREGSTPLFFNRPMNSNPPGRVEKWGDNIAGARGNNDFFAPEVVAVNHFKNAMRGTAEYLSNPMPGRTDLLMIERGGSGAVIINMGAEAVFDGAPVNLVADGVYIDTVSGGSFTVADGRLYGVVPDGAIVVFLYIIDDPILANITEPIPPRLAPEVAPEATITLRARVPAAWYPYAVWAWNYGMAPEATNAFDGWPGEFFTLSEDGWYIAQLPGWVNNIIINGRDGTVQTAALATTPGRDVWISVNDAGVATLSNVAVE